MARIYERGEFEICILFRGINNSGDLLNSLLTYYGVLLLKKDLYTTYNKL